MSQTKLHLSVFIVGINKEDVDRIVSNLSPTYVKNMGDFGIDVVTINLDFPKAGVSALGRTGIKCFCTKQSIPPELKERYHATMVAVHNSLYTATFISEGVYSDPSLLVSYK